MCAQWESVEHCPKRVTAGCTEMKGSRLKPPTGEMGNSGNRTQKRRARWRQLRNQRREEARSRSKARPWHFMNAAQN